jgi:MoaA/NifB/PqqE/SkfB family radical SAM enzyme
MSKKYAKRFTIGARTNGLGFVVAAKPDCNCNCNWCYNELDNELPNLPSSGSVKIIDVLILP